VKTFACNVLNAVCFLALIQPCDGSNADLPKTAKDTISAAVGDDKDNDSPAKGVAFSVSTAVIIKD
jgi:hypothetical protein